MGFIWPSKSSADTLIHFDKKPESSFYLCINYRGFNDPTIKNLYLLPLIGKSLDWLGQAKRFTQLDLISTHYQMKIQEDDNWEIAFCTKYSHSEYQVISFSLSNTPASFQGYINKVLAKKLNIFVLIYLDDILICTKDSGQPHVDIV